MPLRQLVKIQPGESLSNTSELNPMQSGNRLCGAGSVGYHTTTKGFLVIRPEILMIPEAGVLSV